MVEPEVKSGISKNLKARILSTICILPISILAIWNGSWVFESFIVLLGLFLMHEWNRLIGLSSINAISFVASALVGVSVALIWSPNPELGAFCLLGAIFFNLILGIKDARNNLLAFLGPIYIFLPCACIIWIREYPLVGLELTLWLLIVVSTTDIAAYFFGKMIGGPRLAPRISPGKTWSGLFGGVICASLAGTLFGAVWFDFLFIDSAWEWGGFAILIAGTAQIGDLGESWLKRKMSVKDSGTVIPGHGGLLDRLDGFMVSSPLFTALVLLIDLK